MTRWRRSQRHAEAKADWSAWAAAWLWLSTPAVEQRAICTAAHFHAGKCPDRRDAPNHYCHRGRCPARHHNTKGIA
jgi:hypothetical protein